MAKDIGDGHEPHFEFIVNGKVFRSADGQVTGREILSAAGFDPADEHVLIHLMTKGTQSRGIDEKVDLRADGSEVFRAFSSDRALSFTVDGRGFEWGAATISETELRSITATPADRVFVLEKQDIPDAIVDDESDIKLNGRGTEHLKTKPRPLVEIKINTKPIKLLRGWRTGAEIKATAIAQGLPIKPDFTLNLESESGDRVVGDEDRVFIRGGECFDALDNHEDS